MPLPEVFPGSVLVRDGKISLPLEHIYLEYMILGEDNWSPLVAFLLCRTSSGNRLDTLTIVDSSHMCQNTMEHIRSMVRVLEIDFQDSPCPFGTCL